MTSYVLLLHGDERAWENASPEHREAVYARHREFAARLAERGHRITGGAEFTHSRETRQVRTGEHGAVVTDGPYAESVEQLTGFYIVESDDLDDLLDVAGMLTDGDGVVEVRAAVAGDGEPA